MLDTLTRTEGLLSDMHINQIKSGQTVAIVSGVSANFILGASSLYWKALSAVPSSTLVAYRILLSLVTLTLVLGFLRRLGKLRSNLTGKNLLVHGAAGILVAANWATFIWASIHGNVIESGLGYLIAPFITIGLGTIFISESLGKYRMAALTVIAVAILVLIFRSGELKHWVYLAIGTTWGFYGFLKKFSKLDPFGGLFYETAILTLVLCVPLITSSVSLALPQELGSLGIATLAVAGIVSVLPLWLFSLSVARLPLAIMGFFQFVLPTTQVLVALLIYGQSMSTNTAVTFSVIWCVLFVIVVEPLVRKRGASECEEVS